MPIKWFICPDGDRIEIERCLSESGCRRDNRCATRSYLKLVSRERVWTGKPSTTQLINGTMLSSLRLTNEYAVSPDDRAFMIHGTRGHANLQIDDEYSLVEEKLDGDDTPHTGIFDVFESESGKTVLVDYKTSGSFKVAKALGWWIDKVPTGVLYKSGPRKGEPRLERQLKRSDEMVDRWEWEMQLNSYRMGLEHRGFQVDELRIMCVVRDGNTYIARSRGVFRNTYYFRIAKLDDAVVEAYFRKKRHALAFALKYGWTRPCSAEENWNGLRCSRYCEVAEFCSYGKYLRKEKEVEDMPIEGLSNIRRLPRQGKIALGIKKKSEKGAEYPAEVDYFVLKPTTPNEDEANRLIAKFHKLYGEQPKSIQIMFPMSNRESIFPQYYKRYGASSGLKCKGDGKTAVAMSEEFTEGLSVIGEREGMPEVQCLGENCVYQQSSPAQCTRCATLQVLLPELEGAGVWQITTGSFYSIVNLNSSMDYIEAMAGRIHMIPLTLLRAPQKIQHDGKSRVHFPMNIDMAVSLVELMKWAQVDETKVLLELPAPAKELEDLTLENTPEEVIHDNEPSAPPKTKPAEEEKKGKNGNGEMTYKSLRNAMSEKWEEDPEVVGKFLLEKHGNEAKALMAMKGARENKAKHATMKKGYDKWVSALSGGEDVPEQPDAPVPDDGFASIDDLQGVVEEFAKINELDSVKLMSYTGTFKDPDVATSIVREALSEKIKADQLLAGYRVWAKKNNGDGEPEFEM